MKYMKTQGNREGNGETVQDIKVEIEFLQKTQTEIKLWDLWYLPGIQPQGPLPAPNAWKLPVSNGLQKLPCWRQQEKVEAGHLLRARTSQEWPRLVTDFRGTGAGDVGGGGSRHIPGVVSSQEGKQAFLELHSARGQAVIAESVVT